MICKYKNQKYNNILFTIKIKLPHLYQRNSHLIDLHCGCVWQVDSLHFRRFLVFNIPPLNLPNKVLRTEFKMK